MGRRRIMGGDEEQATEAQAQTPPDPEGMCAQCGGMIVTTPQGKLYPCGHVPKKPGVYQAEREGIVDRAQPVEPHREPPARRLQAVPEPEPPQAKGHVENAARGDVTRANGNSEQGENPPTSRHVMHVTAKTTGSEANTVTVTWGKELFSPKQFHTYEVGPFVATGPVLAGETLAQAHARIYAELSEFAEKERTRKRESFMRALQER